MEPVVSVSIPFNADHIVAYAVMYLQDHQHLAAKLDEAQQTLQQAKPLFQNRSLMFNNLIHLFKVVRSIKFSFIKRNEMFTEWIQNSNSCLWRYVNLFDSIYLVYKNLPSLSLFTHKEAVQRINCT